MTHERLSGRPRFPSRYRAVRSLALALMSLLAPLVARAAAIDAPASNITVTDVRSAVAPALPAPRVPDGSPPVAFLEAARAALDLGRTGETQEALERAEARLLSRVVELADVDRPDTRRAVYDIGLARRALSVRDRAGATRAIDDAILAANQTVGLTPRSPAIVAPSAVAVSPPPPPGPPPVTYALLPGHWRLRGATYVWVPPETRLHPVEDRPFVAGRYVWRDGGWVWVPSHYAGS
jgi:WXXGXW repeat (2 copies)